MYYKTYMKYITTILHGTSLWSFKEDVFAIAIDNCCAHCSSLAIVTSMRSSRFRQKLKQTLRSSTRAWKNRYGKISLHCPSASGLLFCSSEFSLTRCTCSQKPRCAPT